jgi:uncharacterized Zn finger protein
MIDPKNTTAIKCEECQNETFREVVFIRKASKLLTGQPQDTVIPIPTFECSKCGHINKEFTPNFNSLA